MNKEADTEKGLGLLLQPFPDELISHLPKPTCGADEYKKLPRKHCKICGGYHAATKTIHLKYVGHAALTSRLLEVDKLWNWKPLANADNGLPLFDESGGLWIELTVCGVTRLGYGHAKKNQYAEVGSREKEIIGDALRNAAMRFGAALDLWSKADLSQVNNEESVVNEEPQEIPVEKWMSGIESFFENKLSIEKLDKWLSGKNAELELLNETDRHKVNVCIKEVKEAIEEQQSDKVKINV